MYKKLINEMLKIIEEKHLDMYFNITKEELNKYVEEVLNKYELNDKYDFYYVGNVIIKKIFGIYDSHTKIVFKKIKGRLPIRLKYIDNKLYIIRTDKNNEDLLYSEILKINNVEVSKLIEEIKDMTAYSTEEYLTVPIEAVLCTLDKLKSLPSINNNSEKFEFEVLKDNQIIKRGLKEQEESLLKLNMPKDNYSYEVIDDKIYIVYNSCREDHEGQMQEFVDTIKKESELNNISKYIIDIRGNLGGNSEIINPLIDYLDGKEVVTLIDEYVFSSGSFAVYDLKNIGSKFIGTGIGSSMNHFGNVSRNELDEFLIPISYKYFYFDKDCNKDSFYYSIKKEELSERNLEDGTYIPFEEMKKNKEFFIPQIFEPDYYVYKTIEDYKNNIDPCLDKAISLFDEKVIK